MKWTGIQHKWTTGRKTIRQKVNDWKVTKRVKRKRPEQLGLILGKKLILWENDAVVGAKQTFQDRFEMYFTWSNRAHHTQIIIIKTFDFKSVSLLVNSKITCRSRNNYFSFTYFAVNKHFILNAIDIKS